MKNLKHINEFLSKIYENVDTFDNESKLKDLLMKNQDFAKGDVHQAIVDIAHDEWKNNDWYYEDICNWLRTNFGELAELAMYFAKYNYQVGNGGHSQYFGNGYASSSTRGYSSDYDNIDTHERFVELFTKLDLNKTLETGPKVYDIISSFDLELEDDNEQCEECGGKGEVDCTYCNGTGSIECEQCHGSGEDSEGEECSNCDGDGNVECEECRGGGTERCGECNGEGEVDSGSQTPNTQTWEKLDDKWYEINDKFMEEFNDYLKSLTLDGEKIEDLIELANKTQKYNL
jgi:hypothetical protein